MKLLNATPSHMLNDAELASALARRARAAVQIEVGPCGNQNFTRKAKVMRFSLLRRSGDQLATTDPAAP